MQRDLARVVMVDNSSLAFKSLEPNAVLIANFYERDDDVDELTLVDELMEHEEVDWRDVLNVVSPREQERCNGYDRAIHTAVSV